MKCISFAKQWKKISNLFCDYTLKELYVPHTLKWTLLHAINTFYIRNKSWWDHVEIKFLFLLLLFCGMWTKPHEMGTDSWLLKVKVETLKIVEILRFAPSEPVSQKGRFFLSWEFCPMCTLPKCTHISGMLKNSVATKNAFSQNRTWQTWLSKAAFLPGLWPCLRSMKSQQILMSDTSFNILKLVLVQVACLTAQKMYEEQNNVLRLGNATFL